jgi:L-galactose dehydrogenase
MARNVLNKLPETFVQGWHDAAVVSRMRYTALGSATASFGPRMVSAIGLGASAFGGVFRPVPQEVATAIVHTAMQAGVNVVDTAPWYGHGVSERVLGAALKGVPRSAYYLHTKVGRYNSPILQRFDFTYERTLASVEESLERIGVDYIDLVQGESASRRHGGAKKICLPPAKMRGVNPPPHTHTHTPASPAHST